MATNASATTGDGIVGIVGIVGIGLIGGSLARDLAARGVRVVAVDPDPEAIRLALEAGAIAEGGPEPARLAQADSVIVAAAPGVARTLLPDVARHAERAAWITDVCGTKRSIVRAAEMAGIGPRFVGSHPLAGGTGTGFAASRADLFGGATVYLCPTTATPPAVEDAAAAFWAALGARPLRLSAQEHDRLLAWTSQLPQAAASMLALALSRAGRSAAELGPGGRDATRLAASSPELWTEIALDSGPLLTEALVRCEAALGELRRAVAGGRAVEVRRLLAEARDWKADGYAT